MVFRTRLTAALAALLCSLLPISGSAQETPPAIADLPDLDRGSELQRAVHDRRPLSRELPHAGLDRARLATGTVGDALRRAGSARRGPGTWREWVADALSPGSPDGERRFQRVFEERLRAPGSPLDGGREDARARSGAAPSDGSSGLDLPDFLPFRLRTDIHRAEARIRELRALLFGQRGIFRLGEDEDSGRSRLRLNLQYDPDPGLRFVLLTR